MKKYIFNFTVILLAASLFFVLNAEKTTTKDQQENVVIEKEDKKVIGIKEVPIDEDHKYKAIDCKLCHSCEYPTINNPCLNECPRDDFISVYHSPDEGPTIVEMDEIPGDYGAVLFSHKIHAQMSVMSGGCETCHHYNTSGPVLKCSKCHEDRHIRDDITVPELEAAYHRQCITCHRQWSGSTDCDFCHVSKDQDLEAMRKMKMEKYTGLDHPALHEPMKVVYETEHETAPLVTFFHNEHVQLFNIDCASCHQDENCISCHYAKHNELRSASTEDRHKHIHKTFEEHHNPCSSCHDIDNCDKCHSTEEMDPFDHTTVTGFDLDEYHSNVKCEACHKNNEFKGLSKNCSTCHKFNSSNFDHKITGLKLDMMHEDFECADCHKNNNYSRTPDCSDCHVDISWPKDKPGSLVK